MQIGGFLKTMWERKTMREHTNVALSNGALRTYHTLHAARQQRSFLSYRKDNWKGRGWSYMFRLHENRVPM